MKKILFSMAMFGLFATPALAQEMPMGEGDMPEKKAEDEVPAGAKEAARDTEKEAKEAAKTAERKKRIANRMNGNFKRLDKDEDGKISKDEAGERLARSFSKWDKDGDGFVTAEEFAKGLGSRERDKKDRSDKARAKRRDASGLAMMNLMDINGDGKISKEEAPKRIADAFEKWDADKDGFVTAIELAAGMKDVASENKKMRAKRTAEEERVVRKDDRYTGPSKRDIEKGRTGGRDVFGNMDTNGDGQISKSEAKGPMLENFAEFDKDGDGQITKQELKGMRKSKGMGEGKESDKKAEGNTKKRAERKAERKAKREMEKGSKE